MRGRIFISYSREDTEIAKILYADLEKRDLGPWMDSKDLLPGELWKDRLREVISECSHFLFLMSSKSTGKKGYVQKEVRDALGVLEQLPANRIFLIPIRIDECSPGHEVINDINWVDIFPSYERGLKKILQAIRLGRPEVAKEKLDFQEPDRSTSRIHLVPREGGEQVETNPLDRNPRHYTLYQINTRIWLQELSTTPGRSSTFDDISDSTLDQISGFGFDWVWLTGVWQTGLAGREVSRTNPNWLHTYHGTLPNFREDDICGSPFAIRAYTVHADFGGTDALRRFRQRLLERGLRLLLDFVPNHTALDHSWVMECPEVYIHGSDTDILLEPHNYYQVDTPGRSTVLAHGRDSQSSGWPDTLQLNYRHPATRKAMLKELLKVAELCDGARCDMAMLILPDVFFGIWGAASQPTGGHPAVDIPFWPEAIERIRQQYPDFKFLAEVYWGLEWPLLQQGFDYTYDKILYDRVVSRDAGGIRAHLQADLGFQRHSVRFLENHDESRAATAFPLQAHRAAAVLIYLLPGLRLFHEGQLSGRKVKASVHLRRRPEEPTDYVLQEFYTRLLECVRRPEVRSGRWQLLDGHAAWEPNNTWREFIGFTWEGPKHQRLFVVVNFSPIQGQCYMPLLFCNLRSREIRLKDLMGSATYDRGRESLISPGLYLNMIAWGYHVFELVDISSEIRLDPPGDVPLEDMSLKDTSLGRHLEALRIWREKLEFYLVELAKVVDPGAKFQLGQQIKEARKVLRELDDEQRF